MFSSFTFRYLNESTLHGYSSTQVYEYDSASNCSSSDSDLDPLGAESGSDDSETELHFSEETVDQMWTLIVPTPRLYGFTGRKGLLKTPTPSGKDNTVLPIDLFRLFVIPTMISFIVDETNKYAAKILETMHMTEQSRKTRWKSTDEQEIIKFLGVLICMDLVRAPRLEHYWCKKQIYNYPFIKNHMSKERFQLLWKYVQFNKCDGRDSEKRMSKEQPLIDTLSYNCRSVYAPGPSVVVEQSVIPFKGTAMIRHYVSGKAHKYGINLYKLCSPNLYTWNFLIQPGITKKESMLQHSESVVLQLAKPLLQQGLTIYGGNFYSSFSLAEKLLQEQTYYCGTVRKYRNSLPPALINTKLKKGEVLGLMNSKGVKICGWRGKRNVVTLSTVPEHSGDLITSRVKDRQGNDIKKPQSVIDYNRAKRGIDRSDQTAPYCTVLKRGSKGNRKLAIELLTVTALVNAWALYNEFYNQGRSMGLTEFKESLAMSLITGEIEEEMSSGPKRTQVGGQRSSHALAEADGPKLKTRKRCRSCYETISNNEGAAAARRKARRVNTYCDSCEGKPFLCISCFSAKHAN